MILILTYIFLFHRYGSSALPVSGCFRNSSTYDAPIFTHDDPSPARSGRTAWDILWSCLATTFAVTWVSVHPNVLFLEENRWSGLRRRIFLMCLTLLAPEVMIMWAFRQWRGALMIRERINRASSKPGRKWSMAHAHWLQMGGFRLRCTQTEAFLGDGSQTDYWKCLQREYSYQSKCTLDCQVWEGVIEYRKFKFLLVEGLIDFPETSEEEINDRSKGDALSKGVVLLQITWFLVQLTARAQQHLSVTELELTTAALAGMNSIMYVFWWSKPLNVRSAIVINTKELERQLMQHAGKEVKHGTNGGIGKGNDIERWTFSEDELRLRDYLRDSPAWVALDLAVRTLCPVWMCTIWSLIARFAKAITSALAIHLKRPIAKLLLQSVCASRRFLPHRTKKDLNPEVRLQSSTDSRENSSEWIWTICKFIDTKMFYLPHILMFLSMDQILSPNPYDFALNDFKDAKEKIHSTRALQLLFHEGDMKWIMSMIFSSKRAKTNTLLYFSAVAGAAFGSIHCVAWNFDFPSPVERVLWRTASLSVVGICLCVIIGMPFSKFVRENIHSARRDSTEEFVWKTLQKVLQTTPVIVYPLARLSLLIIALLSLRHLPPSALETVEWTKLIPHI